jgi:hypothetical protein
LIDVFFAIFIFLISYIMSSNKTSLFGGGEGTYFDQKCPAGEHISQFYGYTYFFPGRESIMGIGAKCSGGADLGVQGSREAQGRAGKEWYLKLDKPEKNFSGSYATTNFTFVSRFMENGTWPDQSPWNDNCPSGAATGVYGRSTANMAVNAYGLQCGPPSNWCIDNLEDPICAGVDVTTLNKACTKNFSETCTNRKAELTDSTMNLYCASNPTAAICSCYSKAPEYIPPEMAGLAPCWNQSCATTGYIPQNMRGACPSITICKQDMSTSGDSNMLTNNIIIQDCKREIPKNNLPDNLPDKVHDEVQNAARDAARDAAQDAVNNARSLSEDQSDIWTPGFILFIILVGIIVGVCVYKVIQYFINKTPDKTSDVTQNEPQDD